MMQHPEQKYISALLHNDAILIKELYDRYFDSIKNMILQNKGSKADALDTFQDALLAIYHKAKTQELVITESFSGFLYAVCRNKWLKEINKRKLVRVTFDDAGEHYTISEENSFIIDEYHLSKKRKILILEKLGKLGESCRKLLHLSWSGKKMEEVAGILNISYAYARKKKCECMAKLVKLVKESAEYQSLK